MKLTLIGLLIIALGLRVSKGQATGDFQFSADADASPVCEHGNDDPCITWKGSDFCCAVEKFTNERRRIKSYRCVNRTELSLLNSQFKNLKGESFYCDFSTTLVLTSFFSMILFGIIFI